MTTPHPIYCPKNRLDEVVEPLAKALAKVSFFMGKDIVKHLAKANEVWAKDFASAYAHLLKEVESNYFYPGSACSFPGIRRKAIKEERGSPARKYDANQQCILDLNFFPRELWSYICTGKLYSAKNWAKSRLGQFELAHILPHKPTELDPIKLHFTAVPDAKFPLGLFTCATNTVLLPKGSARPTDGMGAIRALFLERYFFLYKEDHSGGFTGFTLPKELSILYKSLEWNEPWQPANWKERVEAFDSFRQRRLGKLLGA